MNTYDLNILKSKSKSYYKELEKDILDFYEIKLDNQYNIGIILNYVIEKKLYEVYCYIYTKDQTVSGLKNKLIKNKLISQIYFNYLKRCIDNKELKFFFKN